MLKTASRTRQCGIGKCGKWQEQIVTMYETQIGLVPKGTRAKTNANHSYSLKTKEVWEEHCKWINLCSYINLQICWWVQIAVAIPDDGDLNLWCSNSLSLASGPENRVWHCPSYWCSMIHLVVGWLLLWPQLCYCCFFHSSAWSWELLL